MLIDKYNPFTLNALIGNGLAIDKLNQFGLDALAGKHTRAIMICGPSGTGKTTAARAIAYTNGFEVLELNSSDYRDAETMEKKVLPASMTRGLFNKKVLILFDEIDELSAKFDAGAERVILQLINKSKQPVVFTANDYWDRKIAFLRNHVEKIDFKRAGKTEVLDHLKRIQEKEGKSVSSEILEEIVKRSNGDIRGALNDLEMMFGAKPELIESLSIRDRKMEIFSVLDKIFLSGNFERARHAAASSDVDMSMLINWVDENIPVRYLSKGGRKNSYQYLSKASAFYENASRSNYYGYMRYSSVLLSAGVAVASTGDVSMINRYAFPANIQYLSKVKKGKEALNKIAMKLAKTVHANRKDIIKGSLPVIYAMMEQARKEIGDEAVADFMARTYDFDEKDLEAIAEHYRFTQS